MKCANADPSEVSMKFESSELCPLSQVLMNYRSDDAAGIHIQSAAAVRFGVAPPFGDAVVMILGVVAVLDTPHVGLAFRTDHLAIDLDGAGHC